MQLPTEASVEFSVPRPKVLHVLLSGAYVERSLQNKQVGELDLVFSDGSVFGVLLVAGRNIRETWGYVDELAAQQMNLFPPPVGWKNVVAEQQSRGGRAALGLIDLLSVPIPEPYASATVARLQIRDTSVETANSLWPSLVVYAITLEISE